MLLSTRIVNSYSTSSFLVDSNKEIISVNFYQHYYIHPLRPLLFWGMYFLCSYPGLCFSQELILSHLHKKRIQWFFYFYSTWSVLQSLFLLSQNNFDNKLIFALPPISYCTFIKCNLTALLNLFLQSLSMTSTEPIGLNFFIFQHQFT